MSAPHITVIGAGIVGLATAFELTERGAEVTVFDPSPVSGASYYAGGMLAPAAEVQFQQEPLFPLMLESARRYPSLVERLSQATDRPLGYRTEGTLVVAADRADAAHLTQLTDYQHTHGMRVDRIPVREARRLEPALAPDLAGAVSLPGDHQVAPRVFTAALLDALARRGVQVVQEEVTEIGARTVTTTAGEHAAPGQVVLANGLGAARFVPLALRPVRGDILRVRLPEGPRSGADDPLLTRVVRGFVQDRPIYLIPRQDGTMAVGATTREDQRDLAAIDGVFDLLRDAVRVVPGIKDCELLEAGVGKRPGTPDDLPYLGRVSDRLIVSTGYFRHGILLAAWGASVGARLALGEEVSLPECDPNRGLQ